MWEIIVSLAVVIILPYIYGWIMDFSRRKPPMARGVPLFGNIFQLKAPALHEGLSELSKKYGGIFRINLMGSEILVVCSPALIHEAYNIKVDDFASRSAASYVVSEITYKARDVIFSPSDKSWSCLRKAVHASIKTYGEANIEVQQLIQDELEELVEEYERNCGKPTNPQLGLRLSLVNIIASLCIGRKVERNSLEAKNIESMVEDMLICMTPGFGVELDIMPFLRWIPVNSTRILRRAVKSRDTVLDPILKEAKVLYILNPTFFSSRHTDGNETFNPNSLRGFVDMLIQTQQIEKGTDGELLLSDEHILGSMMDLFVAGVATTFSAVSSLMLICLHYPTVQLKLQEEIDRVIGQGQMPALHHRPDMHYLNAVVLETLRYVSVTALTPRATTRDTSLGGYDIDKDTSIIINMWEANHSSDWGDPWVFQPERFLDKEGLLNENDLRRPGFMPFGAGPRFCVGKTFAINRMFLFIATLWQKFSFFPVEGQDLPSCDPKDFETTTAVTPKPFYCSIARRV